MRRPHTATRPLASILALALAIPAAGGACSGRAAGIVESGPPILWPPPPAAPRVEYLSSFAVPEDLGIRASWFKRFVSYLARGRRAVEMLRPYAIAVDPEGRIAVADPDARCVHVYDPSRSRYERLQEANGDAFVSPVGIAADDRGTLYVADSARQRVFRRERKGRWMEPLGSDGGLLRPTGLAYDAAAGLLYVVDTLANEIKAFDADGAVVRRFGARGSGPGEFNYPVAIAIGPRGRLYVTDSLNFRVQMFDSGGTFAGAFGKPGSTPGSIDKPKGIAIDGDGHIFVVEALHDVVQVFDAEGRLLTIIGGTGTGSGEFWLPAGIHIDARGRIFVADSSNRRVQILQYLGSPAPVEGS